MPQIKINQPTEDWHGTTVEIDGQKIEKVGNIDYHVDIDELPEISLEVVGTADIDLEADYIKLDVSPVNVENAITILRSELSKDNPRCEHFGIQNELRKAFIDSIFSAIDEYTREMDLPIMDKPALAEKILDRLLGEGE